jgi:rubrerythrin
MVDWFDPDANDRGPDQTGSSVRQIGWICPQGHRWVEDGRSLERRLANRHPLTPCPICSAGLRVRPRPGGGKQFVRIRPISETELADEWHPTRNARRLGDVTAGSRYEAWWRCRTCGHEWVARARARARGSGCPKCANTGRRHPRLCDALPDLYGELTSLDGGPVDAVTLGSARRGTWRCSTCGHEWQASIAMRVRGNGCPCCAGRTRRPV